MSEIYLNMYTVVEVYTVVKLRHRNRKSKICQYIHCISYFSRRYKIYYGLIVYIKNRGVHNSEEFITLRYNGSCWYSHIFSPPHTRAIC